MINTSNKPAENPTDQVLARMLAIGDLRVLDQNAAGDDFLVPTAKGVVRRTCEHLQDALTQADRLGRNFTFTEQRELLTHVRQLYQALASSEDA